MDYCSSCRRYLNGALVCPGCGAYAPDVAPVASGGRTVPARAITAPTSDPANTVVPWEPTRSHGTWFEHRPGGRAALEAGPHAAPAILPSGDSEPSGDIEPSGEGAPLAPQGRAARRRQKARWKKTRRRALIATTVVFIGGGLTLASMERSGTDQAQAATAPDLPPTNGGIEEPTDTRRSSPTPTHTPSTNSPHKQSAAAPPLVSQQQVWPDPATAPRTTAPSAQHAQPSSPSSGGSGSGQSDTDTGAQTPTPTPSDDSNSNGGSGSGTTPSNPAPEETSPKFCLLVICLG